MKTLCQKCQRELQLDTHNGDYIIVPRCSCIEDELKELDNDIQNLHNDIEDKEETIRNLEEELEELKAKTK